jgi:GntP family gluconate:H+ symporter
MTELRILGAAVAGIGLSIWLIVKVGVHPFLALLCGAFILGCLAGLGPHDSIIAMQAGFADVLGGTGPVIALGLILGAILQHSGAARALAGAALRIVGERYATWGGLGAAMLIGLPLFFETGVVLLLPIVAAAAVKPSGSHGNRDLGLEIMLAALAGLSVLHALLPPHPGPLLAVHALGASVGRTMLYGGIVAIPTAILAGPIFARYASPHVKATRPILDVEPSATPPRACKGVPSTATLFGGAIGEPSRQKSGIERVPGRRGVHNGGDRRSRHLCRRNAIAVEAARRA